MSAYKTIDAQTAKIMMNEPGVVIVDVRNPDEFATGHIPNAVNIPLDQLGQSMQYDPLKDPDATYLIYCRSGRRSAIAAEIFVQNDYSRIYDFGGILSWPYEVIVPKN
jgi:rhodanese-related sulfurtransferase